MSLKITVAQLESLLNEQKHLCKSQFHLEWVESDLYKALKELDPEQKVLNRIHEVRDKIPNAPYPDEFRTLKKFLD